VGGDRKGAGGAAAGSGGGANPRRAGGGASDLHAGAAYTYKQTLRGQTDGSGGGGGGRGGGGGGGGSGGGSGLGDGVGVAQPVVKSIGPDHRHAPHRTDPDDSHTDDRDDAPLVAPTVHAKAGAATDDRSLDLSDTTLVQMLQAAKVDPSKVGRCSFTPGRPHVDPRLTPG